MDCLPGGGAPCMPTRDSRRVRNPTTGEGMREWEGEGIGKVSQSVGDCKLSERAGHTGQK